MKKPEEVPGNGQFGKSIFLLKSLIILTMGLVSLNSLAESPLASDVEVALFMNSTTCVVVEEGHMAYSTFVKNAVEKHWTITDYEFIDMKEFEKRRSSSKYSFLMLTEGSYEKDPEGVSYDFISLVLGGPERDVEKMPEICSIPISYTNDQSAQYGYIIPYMIKFMQIHARTLQSRRLFISLCGLKYYNRSKKFRDKTLLLNKEMMADEVNSLREIRSVYPNYVELLTTAEIEEELSENPDYTLIHYHVGPPSGSAAGRCFEMIFETGGMLYYYHFRDITNEKEDGFNERDLKRIG
ncbi:MAG: hypothetical protein R6U78_17345 [Bacteroidales bacterium]